MDGEELENAASDPPLGPSVSFQSMMCSVEDNVDGGDEVCIASRRKRVSGKRRSTRSSLLPASGNSDVSHNILYYLVEFTFAIIATSLVSCLVCAFMDW